MIYLLSQMAISLALAAVVGGCIGWLLYRSRYSGQVEQYRKLALRQQSQVRQAQSEVTMLADDYDDLRRRTHAEIDTLKQENRQLPALNQNLEKSQLLVRQLMQKHEAQLRAITAENETLKAKIKNVDHREQALNQLQAGLEKTRKRAQTMSESSVDESDINLSKPARSATKTSGATAKVKETDTNDATDSGDQTSLDLDGEVLAETAIDDPNDELQEFDDREYTDADDESDEDPEYEDSDDIDAEYEDDDVDASDEDGEWEYVYEDEDDDESYGEDAEYDDDADYEDDDEVEYLDDASDRMLQSESKGRRKSAAKAQKKASGKKSSTKKTTKQTAGTEEAVVNRSELTDPEPLEQLFDTVDQHDDLQQIFGIGPVTEKALNKLGITSYSQLADLKNHDIEKIADALQIFPGRIERDNWVGSARRQLEEVLEEL